MSAAEIVDSPANPFQHMDLPEIYSALMGGRNGLPRWPDETLQKGYTGTCGVDLLRRAFEFANMLQADGAFVPGWRGLDYGCGWGRIASVLLAKGAPAQLDLCDAWPKTLNVISGLGYANRVFAVSELLQPGDIPVGCYDFILSFSVFTHLSSAAFDANIPVLMDGLRAGGKLYLTVRHEEFIGHKYPQHAAEYVQILHRDGILFVDSGGNLGTAKVFGDTVVTKDYLARFAKYTDSIRYLGQPHSLQHVFAFEKRR